MIMTIGKRHLKLLAIGLATCFSFCMQVGFAQTLQTITDRKDILIGEQIKLTIKVNLPLQSADLINWLALPDSIPHFEVVERGKIDTVDFKDDSKNIEQVITITSFDSGRWVFPSLPVQFAGEAGQPPLTFATDSFYVNVSYSPPDSTNQLRDIKPIIKVSVTDYFWYYIIGGGILLLIIAILLYRYFKKNKKEKPAAVVSNLSPVNEAMQDLDKLSQYNLQDASEVKLFHIKLADIFKNYLGRKQYKNLTNETTGDLLISIKNNNIPQDDISKLATALRCTDAVKFAKYLPLPDESMDCLQKIKESIMVTETSKPLNS